MEKKKCENKRFLLFYILGIVSFVAILLRLYNLQIVNGEESRKTADIKISLTAKIKAPRGEICDRYGRPLVTNKTGYRLMLEKIDETEDERNKTILNAVKVLISKNQYEEREENKDLSEIIKKYNLEKFSEKEKYLLASIRSDMEKCGFSISRAYVLCEDLSYDLVTYFKENNEYFKSVKVSEYPKREYLYPETCVHILGRTGKISEEEAKERENKDLGINDYIGKQGAEKAFEKFLRGKDGLKSYEENLGLDNTSFVNSAPAVQGDTVLLTIDLDLQIATENALKKGAELVKKTQKTSKNGGAAVVIDVNSGEILASASYPAYDIENFNKDYKELSEDKSLPMFNRALGGLYEPGSTFKPITAIASIDSGNLTPDEKINTKGKYEYKNHIFLCNTYKKEGKTHGTIDVSDALEVSCNYFFFEAGKRCEIEEIKKTAESFGLGKKSGIELSDEEKAGKIASPELRHKRGGVWYPGDTLQASIGQSDNLFTPISLANYGAALANGGTVYKTTILKSVKSSETKEILIENEPKISEYAKASKESLSAVKEGMIKVCRKDGTAGAVFKDFKISVCGKTGSAETSGGTNGLFLCYAPAENPKIAVSVVLENGASGASAASVAKEILSAYFEKNINETEEITEFAPFTLIP